VAILVVDDDIDLVDVVRSALEREGYAVDDANDGATALGKIADEPPELVVLDLGLPKVRGLDVLRQVRADDHTVPVIVLSGRSDEADRIIGLELGADDYVVKPFSPRELVARVRSVLRRSGTTSNPAKLTFPDLVLDLTTREVRVRDEPVDLRRREFDLLAFLCASPRQVFTREQLLRHVWESEPEWQGIGTVSEHVHRLRAKVEVDPARPRRIMTVRGVGYRFVP
jgi:DNA-binding response OmpR family regulator